ncbi:MAG: AAA family ATPase, partial [Ilumatobacteraceae bacterium]
MKTPHGLIIGKFYPPHAGHHLLVRTAAAASGQVTVVVCASDQESIPLDQRVRWMRETHASDVNVTIVGAIDNHPIDYDGPAMWDLHMSVFAEAVASVTSAPVTAVFTSEAYGSEFARRLAALDIAVDPQRALTPVSGTAIRADPVGSWEQLAEPTRGWFAHRVVVIGAESTGTTTVSLALVDALRARGGVHGLTRWVPEYGRDFTIDKLAADGAAAIIDGTLPPAMDALIWRTDEFVDIAVRQNEWEDRAACLGGPVLICDTDSFATGIWHERYEGSTAPSVDALARHHPLYLLTHHDGVPFEQDGIRDGEHIREWMTGRFIEALSDSGRRTVVLSGSLEQRVADGLTAIDELLA